MQKDIITALVVIPLLLLVTLAVISNTATDTMKTFSAEVARSEIMGNNTSATGQTTLYTDYAIDTRDPVYLYNLTVHDGTLCTEGTGYNITNYNGYAVAQIVVGSTGNCLGPTTVKGIQYNITYTPLSDDGWAQFVSTADNTSDGITMANILPMIMLAVLIIGVIVTLFGGFL